MGSLGFVCLIGLYKLSDFMDVLDVLTLSYTLEKETKVHPRLENHFFKFKRQLLYLILNKH